MLELRDNISEKLSAVIKAPSNQISLIITMISIIPFTFLNYFIHGKKLRLIYSFILGLFFQYSIYKLNTIHIFISAIFTYLFMKYFGRKYSAFYVLIGSLLYLSVLHIKRMFGPDDWVVDDPTTIYMMSICKFSSMAFSYEDGIKKPEDIISSHHREYRIVEQPSLLEVLSFIYFYPTSIIGPSIEYHDFINFIAETDCYSRLNENIYYILRQGTLYFLGSFLCMAFYAISAVKLPVSKVVEEDFGKHNIFYTLTYIYCCIPGVRAKFYSGWTLSYATVIYSGAAYTEKKDKENEGKIIKSLDKGSYGSIVTCEWGINPKQSIIDWNQTTHLWLKYNVFLRSINIERKPFKDNRTLASFLTFISSAIWHGFYFTYYLTFVLLYFYQSSAEVFDKIGLYQWIKRTKFLLPLSSVLNGIAFETIGIFFFNLYWDKALIGLRNMRYFPIIYIMGLFFISKLFKVPKKNKAKEEKTKNVNKKVE